MYELKRQIAVSALSVISLTSFGPCFGRDKSNRTAAADPVPGAIDSVEFLKLFHIGMSYADVQAILPKELEQEVPTYNLSENVFVLGVGKSSSEDWGAYFLFDTSDGALRKPEHLVEIDCSATLGGRFQDFESLVREVSGAYGSPVKLDSSEKEQTRTAGWRVPDDSVLTLEYTRLSNNTRPQTCLVDFVIRKLRYKNNHPPAQA
jgi:hypothetical protein